MKARRAALLAFLASFGLTVNGAAAEPPSDLPGIPTAEEVRPVPFYEPFAAGAIRVYQRFLSGGRGAACPMKPSCSEYSLQAFRQYGFGRAFLATTDRLQRCGHDLSMYPRVEGLEYARFLDPLDGPSADQDAKEPSTPQAPPDPLAVAGASATPADSDAQAAAVLAPPDAEAKLLAFADALRERERFKEAVTEYSRFLSYFPGSARARVARRSLFDAYYLDRQYARAAEAGQELLDDGQWQDPELADATFAVALADLKAGNAAMSRVRLDDVAELTEDPSLRDKANLLSGLAAGKDGHWKQAEEMFAKVPPESSFSPAARHCRSVAHEGQRTKNKSPKLAAVLGLVPGLGYFYTGHKASGMSAAIINGLFIWATAEAVRQHHNGLAAALGGFGSGWYLGSISGSAASATRANLARQRNLVLSLDLDFDF